MRSGLDDTMRLAYQQIHAIWRARDDVPDLRTAAYILAIGKVFLRDLGHLEGLYRVGSLTGLAVSLLVVSLFYQRFVFRGRPRVST